MTRVHGALLALFAATGISIALTPSAHALSPEAKSFLVSINLDPDDADVQKADADGEIITEINGDPEVYSLEKLASAKKAKSCKQFVVTRTFLHKLEADFEHTELPTSDYNANFLTKGERQLVGRKVASTLLQKSE